MRNLSSFTRVVSNLFELLTLIRVCFDLKEMQKKSIVFSNRIKMCKRFQNLKIHHIFLNDHLRYK